MNNLLRRVLKKGCEMFNSTGCRILLRECAESDGLTTVEPDNVSFIALPWSRVTRYHGHVSVCRKLLSWYPINA